jgi:TRAP-type C4-dicarboxylate transport system permease small subunit
VNTFEKVLGSVTEKMARVSMVAIVAVMVLVVSNIIKRLLGFMPIPGTFEVVELVASVILGMGIAYLTFLKGHVAVGLLVDRFSPRTQAVFDLGNSVISLGFTIWLTQALITYSMSSRGSGDVTAQLLIPIYPFCFAVSAALALMCVVLLRDLARAVMALSKKSEAT